MKILKAAEYGTVPGAEVVSTIALKSISSYNDEER